MDEHREVADGARTESSPSQGDGRLPSEILRLDHVYEALSHPRRRYLCYTLLEDTEWTLAELARKIAAWENEMPEHEVTEQMQNRVYTSLYHVHVPKLDDEGIVSFDAAGETITADENAPQVLNALEGIGASLDANQEAHARGEMDEGNE